jgi:hypothetical protein
MIVEMAATSKVVYVDGARAMARDSLRNGNELIN